MVAAGFWYITSYVRCGVTILQWQWLWGLERHISTAIHLRITWLWLSESITLFTSIVTSGKWYRFPFFWQPHTHTPAWLTAHCLDLQWTGQHPTAPKHCMTFSNCARCGLQSTRQQMPSNITTSCCGQEVKGSDCWTRGVWRPTSSKIPRTSGTDWLS